MRPLHELLARSGLPDATGGKDEKGNVVVIGGPPTCPGAALLTATAALRVGAGRVQLVVDPAVASEVAVARPEALVTPWNLDGALPDEVRDLIEQAAVVVVGPGCDDVTEAAVAAIVGAASDHVVLDAGALGGGGAIALSGRCTIAPNGSEASRLLDFDGEPAALAARLTAATGRAVAVRDAHTVIAEGDDLWCFDDAPPGLGTPGSGDVYVGVLAGLLACGADDVIALGWSVALHARAGAMLAADTPVGYLASEVAATIPRAYAEMAKSVPTKRSR